MREEREKKKIIDLFINPCIYLFTYLLIYPSTLPRKVNKSPFKRITPRVYRCLVRLESIYLVIDLFRIYSVSMLTD